MENTSESKPTLEARMKARIQEMDEAAEAVTSALGLPREATYDVLEIMADTPDEPEILPPSN